MKYRMKKNKSVVVEAVQWNDLLPLPDGCFYGAGEYFDLARCFVSTPLGVMPVDLGDWITHSDAGNFLVLHPDTFVGAWERIEDDEKQEVMNDQDW